ncbi:AMP-binding protein [Glaciecola sp. 1036]|uniref:AMP-binding protein n=1 Tax=Alteromonadaceae TaxID=72275 RepID=UPI003CFED042
MNLIQQIANTRGDFPALVSGEEVISYGELHARISKLRDWLSKQNVSSVALQAQNSIDWVILDLACQAQGILLTPIPLFFTRTQKQRVVDSAKPQLIFNDQNKGEALSVSDCGISLDVQKTKLISSPEVPELTVKITYTSGSTGEPKGVCLSAQNQLAVASALVQTIGIQKPKHLCLLPLPTLLENIAGVYAPLLVEGTVVLENDEARGFSGSRLVSPQALVATISKHQPNTLILVPELLQLLIFMVNKGWQPPASLQFIAVGGSLVAPQLLATARELNLPVFQGYGLSECGSVVSLCTPKDKIDSVGRILPQVQVKTVNKELVVSGNSFLGYVDMPETWHQSQVHTGDIAEVRDGNLYIQGRIKNTIINSFGRNISPEWIESELLSTGMFSQAVVIGDAKPFCSAILVPVEANIPAALIEKTLYQVNQNLPDYAQVKNPILLTAPMDTQSGLYTANHRPRRGAIQQHFQHQIAQIYAKACA